jgi:hypothetical protein
MPERYDFVFEQPDGVNGAIRLTCADEASPDRAAYWAYLDLLDDGFVIVRDDEIVPPRGSLLEVRADGLWAELVCEVPGEHWSFGLEAFGLRLEDRAEARTAVVGERVPVGFDLEWDEGTVVGELRVGRRRLAFDGRGTFEHSEGEPAARSWADWLDLPG